MLAVVDERMSVTHASVQRGTFPQGIGCAAEYVPTQERRPDHGSLLLCLLVAWLLLTVVTLV